MHTHTDAVADVYARSLMQLAEKAGGHDKVAEVGEEIEQICELARAQPKFSELFRSPIIDRESRATSLRTIFADRVTDLTLRFLLVLNRKGRLGHLDQINAAYDGMVQERFGRIEVDVFTPAEIGEELLTQIRARVEQTTGKVPVVYQYTEPGMIGGIKLRIGDQLIDGSVASKLRRIRHEMLVTGGSSVRSKLDRIIQDAPTTEELSEGGPE